MSRVISGDECDCNGHPDAFSPCNDAHNIPCCDGKCPWCGLNIARRRLEPHIKAHEEEQIRELADANCKAKHPQVYMELTPVGPNQSGFGPPCAECHEAERVRYYQKKESAYGRKLSPQEAEKKKQELGF